MAIFNEGYLNEVGIKFHGKTFLTKEEKLNPKFRKEQLDKAIKIVSSLISSIDFYKNFTSIPTMCAYDSNQDDDIQYYLGNWIRGKHPVIGIANFSKNDYESGKYKDSVDFIIKGYESAKKNDPTLYGSLICTGKYDASIDFKI